jgi:hypothetical protein
VQRSENIHLYISKGNKNQKGMKVEGGMVTLKGTGTI